MIEPPTWDELELPILQWVHGHAWAETGELRHLEEDRASSLLPQVTDAQFDEALRRLREYGLIDGHRAEALVVWWNDLRVTAAGLRVLGEWPPVEASTINVALARVLRALAGDLSEEDATAAKRAGSVLSKMSGDVVLDVVTDRLKSLGEDAVT